MSHRLDQMFTVVRRPSISMIEEGYGRYVNGLRAGRGLPALTSQDIFFNWESADVGGLVPRRAA